MELVAEDLSFSYNGRAILEGVSLRLKSGEVVGVIGPNGSGKTTLIRLLSRSLQPQRGSVYLDGRDISNLERAALARLIAVVPQSPVLPDGFTAEELVLLGRTPHLRFLETEGPGDLQVARRAMELTDTLQFAQRRLGQLSGGEKQRVAIARALAQEPHILLLDEPTTYLDLSHQVEILGLVTRLAANGDLAVLAAFHDLNVAAHYCQRLVLLHNGHVHAEGLPDEVLTPATIAASFAAPVYVFQHPVTRSPIVVPRG